MKNHTLNDILKALLVGTLVLALGACSLPGWEYKRPNNTAWFGEDGPKYNAVDPQSAYEPVVYEINPSLIRALRNDSWIDGLGIDNVPDSGFTSYAVGPGDVLHVVVFGHDGLTNPTGQENAQQETLGRLVGPDGKAFFPFVGQFQAAGKTVQELREYITDGLAKVIRDPQVDVRVSTYHSQRAFVVDPSGNPCAVPLTEFGVTVIDALVICGGQGGAGGDGQNGQASQVVRLVRGDKRYLVDLSQLYKESAIRIYLKNNDRLVIDRNFNQAFLVGEFGGQGAAPIPPTGLTLAEALTSAGGLNIDTADPGAIFVIRGLIKKESIEAEEVITNAEPEVFHLNADSVDRLILADQFKLRPRDVVFVSAADTVNASRAIAQVLPLINTLFQTVFITDRFNRNN